MKGSRIFRVIFGVLVLVIFCVYSYLKISTSPKSSDFDSENAYVYSEVIAEIAAAEAAGVEYVPAADRAAMEAAAQAQAEAEAAAQAQAETEAAAQAEAEALAAAEAAANAPPAIDITSWEYVLVNDANRLGSDWFPPEVVNVSDSQCPVDSRIAEPLMAMAQACKDAGLPVYLSSGYRSYSEQAANFTRVCNNNGVADGKDANGFYITMPAGASEHQTGLCCDITDVYHEIKNAQLENTDTFKWLKEHCTDYGFILRFPSNKQDITGVMYEPFHFRYVGVEVAKYITEHDLCLEEFVALYQNNTAADAAAPAV